MRYFLSFSLLLAVLSGTVYPVQNTTLPPRNPDPSFAKVPDTMDEFLELREKHAYTPEGGAAMFILSMIIFTQNEKLGKNCLTVTLDNSELIKSTGGYKGYETAPGFKYYISRLRDMPWIPFSYIQETSYSQGYALPEGMSTILFSANPYAQVGENTVKIFVSCTGADNPRPILLKKNDKGIWKVKDYSSLFVDVVHPVKPKSDDL